jgi:hypothetical protein
MSEVERWAALLAAMSPEQKQALLAFLKAFKLA